MDQFFESKWFLRILALILALMLFISVHNKEAGIDDLLGVSSINNEEVMEDVPVNVYYDEEKYVVEGVPSQVSVALEGANSLMATTKAKREFEVYANLDGLGVGEHTVKLKYRNISDQLKVKIRPAQVTVYIQEKVMKKLDVEVEFMNEQSVDSSFVIGQPQIDISQVVVVGALDVIENIASVKAKVDLKDIKSSFDGEVPLVAYDIYGNPVDVDIRPKTVNVFVPIGTVTKRVKVSPKTVGALPEGYELEGIEISQPEVTIYGEDELITVMTDVATKQIDLTNLTKTTTIRVPLVK
ncbi:MAG: CdaR family protein, partial [Bacilli bacterium]